MVSNQSFNLNQSYNCVQHNNFSKHDYSINQYHCIKHKANNKRNSRRRNRNKNNFRVLQKISKNLLNIFEQNNNVLISSSNCIKIIDYKGFFYTFKYITSVFRPPNI